MPEQYPQRSKYDAIVVGAGPNGLAAGIVLARAGLSVLIIEGSPVAGGGARSVELTLPGFIHDPCAAVHPFGKASPFFRSLPLEEHGLTWIQPDVPLVHPLDGGQVVLVERDFEAMVAALESDGPAYRRSVSFWVEHWEELFADLVGPLPLPPRHPLTITRVLPHSLIPAEFLARLLFNKPGVQAFFAGMAGHSMLPLNRLLTGAFGLMLNMLSHVVGWPIVQGGTQGLANALISYYHSLGGELVTEHWVKSLAELPEARAILFDTPPRSAIGIVGDLLPAGYRRQLERFRYGQGVFKIDYALDGPIPWQNPGCMRTATLHLGGSLEEIVDSEKAAWNGRHAQRPYVLVSQPTVWDPTRAPVGKHIAWAYCHVPAGSTVDMTGPIEAQIERFAPGFRQRILAKHTRNSMEMEAYNPNYVQGDINSGVQDLWQFFTRPTFSLTPYRMAYKGLYFCGSSTPPGGGVHGLCGYYAAQTVLKDFDKLPVSLNKPKSL